MSLAGLLRVITADPELRRALNQGDAATDLIAPRALRRSWPPRWRAFRRRTSPALTLAVTATAREAEDLAGRLGRCSRGSSVDFCRPGRRCRTKRLSPRSDTSGRRLAVLRRLAHPEPPARAVRCPQRAGQTPVRSLLQPMVSGLGELEPVALRGGQSASMDSTVIAHLVDIGYRASTRPGRASW